jgi:hypothetical protein
MTPLCSGAKNFLFSQLLLKLHPVSDFINIYSPAEGVVIYRHMDTCDPASRRNLWKDQVQTRREHVILFTDSHGPYFTAVELVQQCRGSAVQPILPLSVVLSAVSLLNKWAKGLACISCSFLARFLTRPANTSHSSLVLNSSRRLKVLNWTIS